MDYNPVRLQPMPCSLYITHPNIPRETIRYLIRPPPPPRLRYDLVGDTYWAPWWRTSIMVQSSTSLPLLSMFAHNSHIPQGYRIQALTGGIAIATSYLTSTNTTTTYHTTVVSSLLPTRGGSYIVSHLRKDTFSQLTNFGISMGNPTHTP